MFRYDQMIEHHDVIITRDINLMVLLYDHLTKQNKSIKIKSVSVTVTELEVIQ